MPPPAQPGPMIDLSAIEEGQRVEGPLAVRSVRGLTAYEGGHLVRLELGNATGTAPAKVWLGPDPAEAQALADDLQPGDVLDVQARVDTYRDRLELNVEGRPQPAEDVDPAQLVPSTDAHVGRLVHRCLRAARSIDDEDLRRVVLHVWTDEATRRAIARAPATKRRQRARVGGWIEHVRAELELAETLARVHHDLDRDLLVAGVLLHDLGRLEAYEVSGAIDLTREGWLVGTAALADERLEAALDACGTPDELALHLRHMVLSHAGRAEWGAAVEPATPEAITLHAIERLDTRVARALEVADERRARGQTSGYSSQLGSWLDLHRPQGPDEEPADDAQEPLASGEGKAEA